MVVTQLFDTFDGGGEDVLFANIAASIERDGYCVIPAGMPDSIVLPLAQQAREQAEAFAAAKIGRGNEVAENNFVRRDKIAWIDGVTDAERRWMAWAERLRVYLNRRLLLGLFSYESHFAHYQCGDFYRKHYDAFKGEANRVLSTVLYLNSGWHPDDGGELQIFDGYDRSLLKVTPILGTLVVFLSEEFPHEVLPAQRDRYSIAGWFRLNQSIGGRVDPQY
ncbi:MAG TPA: 2OG-Fe(II) oxygenase [Pseudomonadales bacterium]|nr:2OG-Fe(II) oxygenase [Pseudomonadales bacterium]